MYFFVVISFEGWSDFVFSAFAVDFPVSSSDLIPYTRFAIILPAGIVTFSRTTDPTHYVPT